MLVNVNVIVLYVNYYLLNITSLNCSNYKFQ